MNKEYKIDVHGLELEDAKKYITNTVKELYKSKGLKLIVVHGYNHGTKIKDWLRSTSSLNKYVNSISPSLDNSGETIINLKMEIY